MAKNKTKKEEEIIIEEDKVQDEILELVNTIPNIPETVIPVTEEEIIGEDKNILEKIIDKAIEIKDSKIVEKVFREEKTEEELAKEKLNDVAEYIKECPNPFKHKLIAMIEEILTKI